MSENEEVVVANNEPDPFVANGVTFVTLNNNGDDLERLHTYSTFGMWLSERPDLGSPEPKLNLLEIPGADGIVDLTEINAGEVKFNNRIITLTFARMVEASQQEQFKSLVMNALHGRKFDQIILDEDPGWYYTGRVVVEFEELSSWKLKCVITINAAPYAKKFTQTSINFLDYNQSDIETWYINLRAYNESQQPWNSDFLLGSEAFPLGLPTENTQVLYIRWNTGGATIPAGMTQRVQIVDSDGNVFNNTFTMSDAQDEGQSGKYYAIPYSSITSAGVTISKIYRVLVTFIGGCWLSVKKYSIRKKFIVSRRTSLPVFYLTANNPVAITITTQNGTIEKQIAVGINQYDDVVLMSGENEVYIPQIAADVTTFTMVYQEEKL